MKAVIFYSCGAAWVSGKPHWEQELIAHRKYLVKEAGDRLIAAGPFMDHTGGLVIVEVEKLEEAIKIAESDPAVAERKFNYVVRPWEPLEGIFNPPL
ncbi:hypothetical protein E2R51_12790 [Jeotgalibacillus sp. S-D1]|uniref:YciI family protein n=1 Tax=Jeotgalibacillus sp. S-D1 TaxID=2552189 RepID=UPI001059EF14|nr:YciI family protein [Jeotgalibacillus sp. S-D1]TDL31247.1 hypothetical protein E2R51_12790 [Jeotgalibacillus sp. S-D1]